MDHDRLAGHIESISARTETELRQLVWSLQLRCWPTGGADRSEPDATEWVDLWGPKVLDDPAPGCSCETGRCALCN